MYPVFAFCNDLPLGQRHLQPGYCLVPRQGDVPRLFVTALVLSSHSQPLLDLTVTTKAQILLLEGRDTGTVSFKSLGTALNQR